MLKPRRGAKRGADEAQAPGGGADARTQELLDAYFGMDDQLPEGERFLKSFIRNRVPSPPRLLMPWGYESLWSCVQHLTLEPKGFRSGVQLGLDLYHVHK